ncbi:large hypothetical protein [Streptococcus sp. DD10]|uniref:DUF4352 domain-containing protein n=1 Tax=Streptococcus sp. DD10 TaxID=1777878 RepID=UPI00079C512F|nr:DUF4352 domain-containing protein [Streptococcus sp. DD10]KXT72614.1 large hypothetical protein [Streptococcus sp. DD10]
MKYFKIVSLIASIFIFTACASTSKNSENGKASDSIALPISSEKIDKQNYKTVVNQLEDAGFTKVKTEKIEDLVTGILKKDGQVESVSIAGETEFQKGDVFDKNTPITVTYHTFKKEKKETVSKKDSSSEEPSKEPSSQAESASSSRETPTVTPSYKIGDLVKVGDMEYIVNSRTTAQNVGGEFGVNANGTYLVLNITVRNTGNKAITVTDSFFKLLKENTEFEVDSTAGIYANEDADFFLSDVNPGSSITGNVIFDVTTEVANDPGVILQVQTGFWGTQKGKIQLN